MITGSEIYSIKDKFIFHLYFLTRNISEQLSYNSLIKENFRPVENTDSLKKPIIIFGCSYAHGSLLNENQTFSFKLGKYTQRPIYNRAKCGWGVQHMYYQLTNDDFYKIIPKPEYIIYVYMDDHKLRMKRPVSLVWDDCYVAFYKKCNNNYILKKRTFFSDKMIFQHFIGNYIFYNYLSKNFKYNHKQEKDLVDYIIASRKAAEDRWGKDIKFIVFTYVEIEDKEILQYIKDNKLILFNRDVFNINLEEPQYQYSPTDTHPNEKAWDDIVPILVKKYNMN